MSTKYWLGNLSATRRMDDQPPWFAWDCLRLAVRVIGSRKSLRSELLAPRTLQHWMTLCSLEASSCPSQLGWEKSGFQLQPWGKSVVYCREAQVLGIKTNSSSSSSKAAVHTPSWARVAVFLSLPATHTHSSSLHHSRRSCSVHFAERVNGRCFSRRFLGNSVKWVEELLNVWSCGSCYFSRKALNIPKEMVSVLIKAGIWNIKHFAKSWEKSLCVTGNEAHLLS